MVYAAITVGIVAFQIAMAAGMPWGAYAMGGAYPDVFRLRFAWPRSCRRRCSWCARWWCSHAPGWRLGRGHLRRALRSGSSLLVGQPRVLNVITPSEGERAVWAPVAALMLTSSLVVAITSRSAQHARRALERGHRANGVRRRRHHQPVGHGASFGLTP